MEHTATNLMSSNEFVLEDFRILTTYPQYVSDYRRKNPFRSSKILADVQYHSFEYGGNLLETRLINKLPLYDFYVAELPQVHGTSILGMNPNCLCTGPGD